MTTPYGLPNLIIGTAGHVDHGKTALIERLTGINADRLREEQERGLTIDLGFAWFQLPGGAWAGIVDVPGHERFVKNMLAGATGIDLFLLVVAADEGVMPQTREHLTILNVLEVPAGMVVVTKADLVDADMLALVCEDISQELAGTVFEGLPMLPVSARTGEGIGELVAALDDLAGRVRPRDIAGPTRMQLDRSFILKGLGTVVTGSLVRGRLRVDQELEILPRGLHTRARSLEVYGRHMEEAVAPCRVGVNLAGIGRDEVERGDQLVAPDSMTPSWMLDVRLRLAPDADRPLEHRERVRVHHGAGELLGRVVLLDADLLPPGHEALAQLRLEAPAVAAPGDRFVIRRYSPAYTIGGGAILDPSPTRHRRREGEMLDRLRHLESGSPLDRARSWVRERREGSFEVTDLAGGLQLDEEQAEALVGGLESAGDITLLGPGRYADAQRAEALRAQVLEALDAYHLAHPLEEAMPTPRLQAALGSPPPELHSWALKRLREEGLIAAESGSWRRAGHQVRLADAHQHALDALRRRANEAGMSPLTREEALALFPAGDAQALLALAVARGVVVPVGEFVISRAILAHAAGQLTERYQAAGPVRIADVRDLWGTTRKYVIPLLEFFDGAGFTRREGDLRHVRASWNG